MLGPFGAVVGALFRRNGANISAQGNALGRRRHPNPRALPWADLLAPFRRNSAPTTAPKGPASPGQRPGKEERPSSLC